MSFPSISRLSSNVTILTSYCYMYPFVVYLAYKPVKKLSVLVDFTCFGNCFALMEWEAPG